MLAWIAVGSKSLLPPGPSPGSVSTAPRPDRSQTDFTLHCVGRLADREVESYEWPAEVQGFPDQKRRC